MNQALERQTFSVAEREQIRKKLLFYMKDHRIGVPALANRIDIALQRKLGLVVRDSATFPGWPYADARSVCGGLLSLCRRFDCTRSHCRTRERLSIFYGAGTGHDYSGIYVSIRDH